VAAHTSSYVQFVPSHHRIPALCRQDILIISWDLPNFLDGTGRFRKMHVPTFQDAGTVTEIPTCLKSRITENQTCLKGKDNFHKYS